MNLNKNKRLLGLLLITLALLLLTGCSGRRLVSSSWPGILEDDGMAYITFGPQVYAVNPTDQRVEWQYDAQDSQSTYYAPPIVSDGVLIVGGYDSVLYGIDRQNLQVKWNFHLASDRYVAAPALVDGRVYAATAGNELFVLDLAKLEEMGSVDKADESRRQAEQSAAVWSFTARHGIWATPLVTADLVYVTSLDHNVYALETATGNLVWSTELPGAMAGSPVLSEDGTTLYVGNFDYNLYALDVATGEQRWQVESENWIWSQPVLTGDKLFFADLGGYVYAVDPQSGDVLWSEEVADAIRGVPAYDAENRVLYVTGRKVANPGNVSTRGVVRALDVDTYQTLWEQPVDEAIYTGPVLSNGLLLVAPLQGDTLMQVYNAETGVLQWQFIPNPES